MSSARRLLPVFAVAALVFLPGCGSLWGLGADSPDPGTVMVRNDDDTAHTVALRVVKVNGSSETDSASGDEVPAVEEFVWRETLRVTLSAGERRAVYHVEEAGTYVFAFDATDVRCVFDDADVVSNAPNGEGPSSWRVDPAQCAGNGTAITMHSFERDTETPVTGLSGTWIDVTIREDGSVSAGRGGSA